MILWLWLSFGGGEHSLLRCPELEVLRAFISSPFRFLIGGHAMGWCSQGCQAIVDTGTSLLTIPQQYLSALLQATGAEADRYGQVSLGEASPSFAEAHWEAFMVLLGVAPLLASIPLAAPKALEVGALGGLGLGAWGLI